MLNSSDTFRRLVVGVSLIGAFVALLASELLAPSQGDGNAELLAAVADHHGAWLGSNVLLLASTILFVPAVFGVLHLVRDRTPRLGHFAAGFGILGALGHVGYVTYSIVVYEAARVGARGEMVALLDRLDEGASVILLPLILSFAVSVLLLGIALYRARIAPRWVMLAVIAAVVIEIGAPGTSIALAAVKQGLGAAAFGYVGVRVLRMSDSAWLGVARPDPGLRAAQQPA